MNSGGGGRDAHKQAQHPGSCAQQRHKPGSGLMVGEVNSESHCSASSELYELG